MFVFRTVIWGTIILFLALIAGPWLALQFDTSFPVLALGKVRYAGVALMAMGIPLSLYCAIILFLPGKKRPAPYDAGGVFVISGPYCFVRNPFMLGVILTLWGEALLTSRIVMIAYALIFTWSIHFWVIFFEEPALEQRFGKEYEDYRNQVPRWLPQFRKYRVIS